MSRLQWSIALVGGLLFARPSVFRAEDLSNKDFQIRFDASGIRSLKRTSDVHDTEYLGTNGILGSLVVRYRSAPNGDWRELREIVSEGPAAAGQTYRYRLSAFLPTLAAKSTASAAVGVGGLRSLNDGQYPPAAGRGIGAAGRTGGTAPPGAAAPQAPSFTWSGSRGEVQWVQYTFPTEEEVSRSEVFWIADPAGAGGTVLPQSWRLLYREGREWKEVQKKAPYALEPNA